MNQDLAEMPLEEDIARRRRRRAGNRSGAALAGAAFERNRRAARHRRHAARSDADAARSLGAAGAGENLHRLLERTNGALALVSGRSLNDIDLIFAPDQFPARRRPRRGDADSRPTAKPWPPMRRRLDKELKRRLAAIAKLSPGILLEDKGYSLALHYRLAPHAEKAIYEAVSLIRADLPNAPIEVLPGKCVCEIKHSGFTKASGVLRVDDARTFQGPPSVLHRRRRHRRNRVRDHAGSRWPCILRRPSRQGRRRTFRCAERRQGISRASA